MRSHRQVKLILPAIEPLRRNHCCAMKQRLRLRLLLLKHVPTKITAALGIVGGPIGDLDIGDRQTTLAEVGAEMPHHLPKSLSPL